MSLWNDSNTSRNRKISSRADKSLPTRAIGLLCLLAFNLPRRPLYHIRLQHHTMLFLSILDPNFNFFCGTNTATQEEEKVIISFPCRKRGSAVIQLSCCIKQGPILIDTSSGAITTSGSSIGTQSKGMSRVSSNKSRFLLSPCGKNDGIILCQVADLRSLMTLTEVRSTRL